MKDPVLEEATVQAILALFDKVERGLRDACLLQDDRDEKAKPIEWYRGGAQILSGLRGEIEFERERRLRETVETPEDSIAKNLDVLEKAGVRWSPVEPFDPNREL